MVDLLIDTSVIIEKLRTKKGIYDQIVLDSKNKKYKLYTSSIVIAELWKGSKMDNKLIEKDVEFTIKPMIIMTVDKEIGKVAGTLVRKKQIDGLDAFIAATAIVHGATLATLNTKHFVGIKGLKLYKTENFFDLIKKFPKVKGLTAENYDKRYREAMMKKHGKYLSKIKKNAKV